MNSNKIFYAELAYLLGIIILALGTAMMERGNFGMSMVVAPAYLVHLKLSQTLPFFTFGMAEYCLQAVLLVVIAIVMRRLRLQYLFSFCTAVFYGMVLDAAIWLIGLIPSETLAGRILFYGCGMALCAAGVSLLFHTYISPEAYELFVKEISGKYGRDIHRVKTVYDCCSCLVAVLMSFAFFGLGHSPGVKWGTILCAALNGTLIGFFSRALEARFTFRDALGLRRFFE